MSDISQPPPSHPPTTPEQRERGRRIRAAREAIGISMGEMARAIGASVTKVSDVERGFTSFDISQEALYNGVVTDKWKPETNDLFQAILASKPVELPVCGVLWASAKPGCYVILNAERQVQFPALSRDAELAPLVGHMVEAVLEHDHGDQTWRLVCISAFEAALPPSGDDLRGLAAREAITPQPPAGCSWCHMSGAVAHLHGERRHETWCPVYQDQTARVMAARIEAIERALADVGAQLRALSGRER